MIHMARSSNFRFGVSCHFTFHFHLPLPFSRSAFGWAILPTRTHAVRTETRPYTSSDPTFFGTAIIKIFTFKLHVNVTITSQGFLLFYMQNKTVTTSPRTSVMNETVDTIRFLALVDVSSCCCGARSLVLCCCVCFSSDLSRLLWWGSFTSASFCSHFGFMVCFWLTMVDFAHDLANYLARFTTYSIPSISSCCHPFLRVFVVTF